MSTEEFNCLTKELEAFGKEWARKGQRMSKDELLSHLYAKCESVNENPIAKARLVDWVMLTLKLDENVENSHSTIMNIVTLVISVLSLIFSVLSEVANGTKMMMLGIGFLLISIVIAIIIMVFGLMKKHSGGYARERAYYEILLEHLTKV